MENNRIPVTIITGFLGSGKTTLLNNIVKRYTDKKFAIIENEFGEIGIDGDLIVGVRDSIFELSNGCICCSLNDDFSETLQKLLGSEYSFNHLIIETTGIADPDSIIQAFLSSENVQQRFVLDSVICLADAINMEDLINEQAEVRKQLVLSDIVILNKIEGLTEIELQKQVDTIKKFNQLAQIYKVSFANIDNIDILDTFCYSGEVIENSTMSFRNITVFNGETFVSQSAILQKGDKKHQHEIISEGFVIPGSFDLNRFSLWMQNYLYFNNKSIFRVKGIVSFPEMSNRAIIHAVRGNYMFEEGQKWESEERFNKLIFIGKQIDRDMIEDALYKLLVS